MASTETSENRDLNSDDPPGSTAFGNVASLGHGPCFGPAPSRPKANELDSSMEATLKSLMATALGQDPSGSSVISCFSDVILGQMSQTSFAPSRAVATVSERGPSTEVALKSLMVATLDQDPSGSSILRCLTRVMSRLSCLPDPQQALHEFAYIRKAKGHLKESMADILKTDPHGESIARALERTRNRPPQDGCTDVELDMRVIMHGDPSDLAHIVGYFFEAMEKHHGRSIVTDGLMADELTLRTLKAVLRPYKETARDEPMAADGGLLNDGPATSEELQSFRHFIAQKVPRTSWNISHP